MAHPSYLDITRRISTGLTKVSKFGRNGAVGTTTVPITIDGVYRTPQVSGATALRVRAGNANDAAAGSGARAVTLEGLDETGAFARETIATNGESAGALSTTTWLRVFRCYVSASGTYASTAAGSHSAAIVIETSGGTEWAQISATGFPEAQSLIAAYSVPLGFHAYVTDLTFSVDSAKTADVLFFRRDNILQTAAPYSAMRLVEEYDGVSGFISPNLQVPLGPFSELTDIGFMARVAAGTADVSASFSIILNSGDPRTRSSIPQEN